MGGNHIHIDYGYLLFMGSIHYGKRLNHGYIQGN